MPGSVGLLRAGVPDAASHGVGTDEVESAQRARADHVLPESGPGLEVAARGRHVLAAVLDRVHLLLRKVRIDVDAAQRRERYRAHASIGGHLMPAGGVLEADRDAIDCPGRFPRLRCGISHGPPSAAANACGNWSLPPLMPVDDISGLQRLDGKAGRRVDAPDPALLGVEPVAPVSRGPLRAHVFVHRRAVELERRRERARPAADRARSPSFSNPDSTYRGSARRVWLLAVGEAATARAPLRPAAGTLALHVKRARAGVIWGPAQARTP